MNGPPGLEQALRVELVRLQFRQVRALGLGAAVTVIFLFFWFSPQLQATTEWAWLAALTVMRAPSLLLLRGLSDLDAADWIRRGRIFVGINAMSGLCWAMGAYQMFAHHGLPDQMMFLAVFCGIGAGATATQVALRWSIVALLMPPVLTIAIMLLLEGGTDAHALLGMLALYLVALWLIHGGHYSELVAGLRSRLEREQDQVQLRAQSETLAGLLRLKEFFIAAASHDLRQPAQAVQLLARTVHDSTTDPAQSQRTGALLAASDQISDLINRLLDLARLDLTGEKANPQWTDLGQLVAQMWQGLELRAEQAGVRLGRSVPPGIEVHADPLFLTRILQNLLLNAIEHARARRVELIARLPAHDADPLRLIVGDDGVGIDSAAARLLDTPERPLLVDSASPSVRGLGLAIAARLAHIGGQRLTVSARKGQGTRFSLVTPGWRRQPSGDAAAPRSSRPEARAPSRAAAAPPAAIRPVRAARGRALLIEDDALVRLGLEAMLAGLGFAAEVWYPDEPPPATGEDDAPLVMILADWQLGDGLTAAGVVPAVQAGLPAALPVVILTGLPALPMDVSRLSQVFGGVRVRVLQKPVSEPAVRQAIGDVLSVPQRTVDSPG